MRPLLERIRGGEVIIGDGGMGTLLIARGLRPGVAPETYNLDQPSVLEEIARDYVEAGAEIVSTNTFGASPLRLAQHGLHESLDEINRRGVEAARRGTAGRAYVAGDVGPCGRVLKPYGDVDHGEVAEGFQRQVRALHAAGVDLIYIETMTDLTEALLAVRAAKAAAHGVPVVATMTFERTRRGFFTVMGTSIAQAASELTNAGADVVGSNCGNGIEVMVEIARQFRAATERPIAIQSNAGLPERRGGALVYPESPEFTAAYAAQLADLGVSIIGGCCGTTPAHIGAIRTAIAARDVSL